MNKWLKYFFVVALTGYGAAVSAQSFRDTRGMRFRENSRVANPQGVNKIQAAKETYINMQLQLTQDEADRFWPVYRQYEKEIAEVRRAKRSNLLNSQPNSGDQINKELYYEEKLVELHRHYTAEFLKILPSQKVSLIYKSERQFNDELIRQVNERKGTQRSAAPAYKR